MPTALTAATASSTLPGPTGSPAARKVRAKCIRLATSLPSETCAAAAAIQLNSEAVRLRERKTLTAEGAEVAQRTRWLGNCCNAFASLRATSASSAVKCCFILPTASPPHCEDSSFAGGGGDLGLDLLQEARRLAALHPGDVILVFQQDAQGVVDRLRRQFQGVELHQGLGPVDRLGDAGQFEQIHPAQFLDEFDDLARQLLVGARRLALQDLQFALGIRIVDPVIEAA